MPVPVPSVGGEARNRAAALAVRGAEVESRLVACLLVVSASDASLVATA